MFQPGSYCEVSGNYQLIFDVNELVKGIHFIFQGEYGNNIDFEGSRFTVQLSCFISERVNIRRQIME